MSDALAEPAATFYFDLASPLCYLAAERILPALGMPAAWHPVLAGELPHNELVAAFGRVGEQEAIREHVARRATELSLQPLVWPRDLRVDSRFAMLVATYARQIGRVVPFAQAAFRQAFAAGRDLSDPNAVMIAAAACEMHPKAVLQGAQLRSVSEELERVTREAGEVGVSDVPAIRIGEHVFLGERCVEDAAGLAGAAR
jgi:2-hydroxychromene-2-carboxylate isomerase